MNEKQNWQEAYDKLHSIILKRQAFEADNPAEPYASHKTTLNYQDAEGRTLIELAINLGDKEKVTKLYEQGARSKDALKAALQLGHRDIAQYLYNQGENATTISLSNIKDTGCREYFKGLLQDSVEKALQSAQSQTMFFDEPPNKLFEKNTFLKKSEEEKDIHDRMAELGDISLLESILSSNNTFLTWCKWSLDSMMTHAASNNRADLLQWLVNHEGKVNTKLRFSESPLIAASKNNNLEALNFLIKNSADINYQGKNKETAFLAAVSSGHLQIVERLIEEKADLLSTNTIGNTALHYATIKNNTDMISLLLKQPEAKKLLETQDIYGMTPLDYAIARNYSPAIKLLDPSREELTGKSAPFLAIDQNPVMRKMRYYLSSQYRDLDFFSTIGHCNGFDPLHDMYAYKGMGNYYFDTLRLMVAWDGTQEALEKPFDNTMPQSKYYKNLAELFEQWTNDIIWFQHSTVEKLYAEGTKPDQKNRAFQYQIIGNAEMRPVLISNPGYGYTDIERFTEDINLFSKRMLPDIRLEIGGSHVTSTYINAQNEFSYYDSNFSRKARPIKDAAEFAKIVIDTKIIALGKASSWDAKFINDMYFFYYDDPELVQKLEKYETFSEEELPHSEQEAKQYQEQSPNGYTHLHVAVLTGSVVTTQNLISLGYRSLYAKNKSGLTALDIALNSKNKKLINLFLMAHNASNLADSKSFLTAYRNNNQELIEILSEYYDKIDLPPIFFEAIRNKDTAVVKRFLSLNIIDINTLRKQGSALTIAIKTRELELIKLLLENGASLFKADKEAFWDSPLEMILKSDQGIIEGVLPYIHDLNQPDDLGNSLIHYLYYGNCISDSNHKLILNTLIEQKADLNITSAQGKTIFDIIEDSFSSQDRKEEQYKLLIPNIRFDKDSQKGQETLKKILFSAMKVKNIELIKIIIPQCSNGTLNSSNNKGVPLLLYACAYSDKDIVENLLESGADINILYKKSTQVSCSHFLKKNGSNELIKLFLGFSADFNIKNQSGQTALGLANESANEETNNLFKNILTNRPFKL